MKKIIFIPVICFLLLVSVKNAAAENMSDYTDTPIFMGETPDPNVLVILDNSGSMLCPAYWKEVDGTQRVCKGPPGVAYISNMFDPGETYYGYFGTSLQYSFAANKFSGGGGPWSGNFLNWVTMRRLDIARKVIMGGKANPRALMSAGTPTSISAHGATNLTGGGSAENGNYEYIKSYDETIGVAAGYFPACGAGAGNPCYFGVAGGYVYLDEDNDPFASYTGRYNLTIALTSEYEAGIIQQIYSRMRLAMMYFKDETGGNLDQEIKDGDSLTDSFINDMQNTNPTADTTMAETLWTARGYFAQDDSNTDGKGPNYGGNAYSTGTVGKDPFYYGNYDPAQYVSCCKSYVVLITDGEANNDGDDLPAWLRTYLNKGGGELAIPDYSNVEAPHYGYLDDVAYYAHTQDLRGDNDLTGDQVINLYVVGMFASGSGEEALKQAAKYGGYNEKDGVAGPSDVSEYDIYINSTGDFGSDDLPDTYYPAKSGSELKEALERVFTEILKKATSGTAISVLATSASGAGNIFQAFFLPTTQITDDDGTREITWQGHLLSLSVDALGSFRDINDDCIIFEFNPTARETYVKTFPDSMPGVPGGECVEPADPPETPLTSFENYNWDAAVLLHNRDTDTRTIYTFDDDNEDGVVDAGEFIKFHTDNVGNLQKYLRVASLAEATDVINWVRGDYVAGYRDRTEDGKQWKLGDIVYSTPTVVGAPQEAYDIRYQDTTFTEFYNAAADDDTGRRSMIYIGANDGMLHAFDSVTGSEVWSYIPYNLLPHLKWLTDNNYSHVNYVDLKVKITDAQIFACDATHVGTGDNGKCWGTVLISGMRFGGGEITNTGYDLDGDGDVDATDADLIRKFRSAYFAIDITDPDNPNLLWEYGHFDMQANLGDDNALGFTMSYPTIVSVEGEWFVVFGTGSKVEFDLAAPDPPDYEGIPSDTQFAKLIVLDLETGQYKTHFTSANAKSFMSNPIAVDMDGIAETTPSLRGMHFGPDVIYVGETYESGADWNGTMYRIVINDNNPGTDDTDPTNWQLTTFYETDPDQPITAAPSLSMDSDSVPWLFFGTGKYLSKDDKSDDTPTNQSFFGIKDQCWPSLKWDPSAACPTVVKTGLVSTTGTQVIETTDPDTGEITISISGGEINTTSNIEEVIAQVAAADGWYFNFDSAGEKSLNKPIIIGGLALFTTFESNNDVCGFGGESFIYAVYYETGTAYITTVFEDIDYTGDEIRRRRSAGTGMASGVSIHSGRQEGASAFVQLSTGEVLDIGFTPALDIKSKIISWREL